MFFFFFLQKKMKIMEPQFDTFVVSKDTRMFNFSKKLMIVSFWSLTHLSLFNCPKSLYLLNHLLLTTLLVIQLLTLFSSLRSDRFELPLPQESLILIIFCQVDLLLCCFCVLKSSGLFIWSLKCPQIAMYLDLCGLIIAFYMNIDLCICHFSSLIL